MIYLANRTDATSFALACLLAAVAVCVATTARTARGDDSLSQLRGDVRRPSLPDDDDDDSSSHHRSHDDDHHHHDDHYHSSIEGDLVILGAYAAGYVATSPIWVPQKILRDDMNMDGYFARFPYAEGLPGYMMIEPYIVAEPYSWAGRLRGEFADDFTGVERFGGHFLLESTSRWGIDTETNYRRQDLFPLDDDSLWTGDANVVFRFAQNDRVQMRAGVGFNWLTDREQTDFGFNFTYGGDLFPCKPWVFSADIDLGSLGNATLFHVRATGGIQWRGVELYTGYDYFDVGNTQIDGWVSGVRIWF
jgi:hypothetical protein